MDAKESKSSPSDAAKSPEQPLSAVLVVVGSILLCLFVVTLDRTIVATVYNPLFWELLLFRLYIAKTDLHRLFPKSPMSSTPSPTSDGMAVPTS